jgi:hypothetical protein
MKLFHCTSLLKMTYEYCLHDASYQTLEYHVHTLMGSSLSHSELVFTFIINTEQVLQELCEPAILHFQMKPTLAFCLFRFSVSKFQPYSSTHFVMVA